MEDRKQEIVGALDAIADRVEYLTTLSKKIEEKKYFSSCEGNLIDSQGRPQWQLYHSILGIIDLLNLTYTVKPLTPGSYTHVKIKVGWGKCVFMELVKKEEYDAWLSERRK